MATQERWEQLTSANDDIDAQLLVGVLEDAGIPNRVVKDRTGYGDYLMGGSNPWAPVAVHVHPDDLDRAGQLLVGARSDVGAEPEGASPIEEGELSPVRRWRWPTVVAIGIVAVIVLAFLLEQRELVL